MIKNIVFDIGNVLIGFDAREYLTSLFGREKAIRVAQAVFGTGYWVQLDIAVMSEDSILELFISAAPETGDENRVPRAAQVDGSDAFMAHGQEFRHFTGHTFFFKFPAEDRRLRGRSVFLHGMTSHRIICSVPDPRIK